MRLSSLFEERGDAYANANARVSLESKCSLWPFVVIPQKKNKIEMKFRFFMVCIICCADIAAKMGYRDVSNLSPAAIALEV